MINFKLSLIIININLSSFYLYIYISNFNPLCDKYFRSIKKNSVRLYHQSINIPFLFKILKQRDIFYLYFLYLNKHLLIRRSNSFLKVRLALFSYSSMRSGLQSKVFEDACTASPERDANVTGNARTLRNSQGLL